MHFSTNSYLFAVMQFTELLVSTGELDVAVCLQLRSRSRVTDVTGGCNLLIASARWELPGGGINGKGVFSPSPPSSSSSPPSTSFPAPPATKLRAIHLSARTVDRSVRTVDRNAR